MSKPIIKVSINIGGVLVTFEEGQRPSHVIMDNRAQIPETEIVGIEVKHNEAQVKIWYKGGTMQEYNSFPYVVHATYSVKLKGAGSQ